MHTWGLYGVYIFFVLSGASLTIAYKHRLDAGYPLTSFLLLRLARLGPLFVLASLVMLAHKAHADGLSLHWAWLGIVSSSLFFGLGNPGANSLVLGGWSLGIELVFYLVFSTALAFTFSRHRWAVAGALLLLQIAFVELTLGGGVDFRQAWPVYIQPLAFVAYFYAGCLIGRFLLLRKTVSPGLVLALALICLPGVLFLSAETASLTLTGWRGFVLLAMSIGLVFAASQFNPRSTFGRRLCDLAGEISYGTYLLHPIIFLVASRLLPSSAAALIVLPAALVGAWALEHYYERPVRNHAKRMIDQLALREQPG